MPLSVSSVGVLKITRNRRVYSTNAELRLSTSDLE